MPEESRTLIERAFEMARESGRPDWHRMSVAVLKNQLLDLTERTFREIDHGASTFLEFVRQHGDLLEVDSGTTPPVAILKGVRAESLSGVEFGAPWRIRADLWRAVLDFTSGRKYFWDPDRKFATSDGVSELEIPTITADTFNDWKRAFAETVEDAASNERLSDWAEHRRPASFLPPWLRRRWIGHLKTEVHKRLEAWFGEQGMELPSDFLKRPDPGGESTPGGHLRNRLIDCLRTMTPHELERVQIPASVLLRLQSRDRVRSQNGP